MTYEPYLTLPDEYRQALTVAARREGFATNAAYVRYTVTRQVQEDAPDQLPDGVEPSAEPPEGDA